MEFEQDDYQKINKESNVTKHINSLYEYVFDQYRNGYDDVYNPIIGNQITLDKFYKWVVKNNPKLLHK